MIKITIPTSLKSQYGLPIEMELNNGWTPVQSERIFHTLAEYTEKYAHNQKDTIQFFTNYIVLKIYPITFDMLEYMEQNKLDKALDYFDRKQVFPYHRFDSIKIKRIKQ